MHRREWEIENARNAFNFSRNQFHHHYWLAVCYANASSMVRRSQSGGRLMHLSRSWWLRAQIVLLTHSHTRSSRLKISKTSSTKLLRERTHQGLSLFISNLCYETHFNIESTFRESISIRPAFKKTDDYNSLWAVKKSSSDGELALMLHVIDSGDQLSTFMNGAGNISRGEESESDEHFYTILIFTTLTWAARAREFEVQRSNLLVVWKWKGELELFFITAEHAMWTINHPWAICLAVCAIVLFAMTDDDDRLGRENLRESN